MPRLVGLSEAYQRRRKRELDALGAVFATAQHDPKKLGKVVPRPESRLHGGRQRVGERKWWGGR